MGWTNQVVQASEVIIGGAPDALYVYNGNPGPGDLITSIVGSAATTDPFANPVKPYTTVYGAGGTYVQLNAGTPATVRLGTGDANEATPGLLGTLIDGAGTVRALASTIQAPQFTGETAFALVRLESSSEDLTTSSPFILLDVSNTAGNNSQVIIDPTDIRMVKNTSLSLLYLDGVNNKLVAGYPIYAATSAGAITPADFTYPALLNGWVNNASFGRFGYRKVASPPNSVELTGAISGNAATAATFATIPFTPATAGGRAMGTNTGNGGATMVANIRWDTSGNLTVNNNAALPVAATFLFGGTIPLDAT